MSIRILISIILFSFVVGCTNTQRYAGPARPANEIAILQKTGAGIGVHSINGEYAGLGSVDHYEFLPGRVAVTVVYNNTKNMTSLSGGEIELEFVAKAGTIYQLQYSLGNGMWRAWIIEKITGEIVSRGETL